MSALTQNTPEWVEMRKSYIGASDAPIVMGVSSHTTPFKLWEQKLGLSPPTTQNYAMQRGHEMEEPARRKLEELTGMLFRPMVKFHPTIEWMMCSSDAVSLDESTIGEIKWAGKEDHEKAQAGIMPDKHFPQLQHQMEVWEKDSSLYLSFDGEDGAIVKIFRDDKYINSMLQVEKRFYECIQNLEAPKMTNADYLKRGAQRWLDSVSRWEKIQEQLKRLKEEEKEARASLIGQCQGQSSHGGGIFVRRIVEKGRIDYSQVPELKNVNLDVYRKQPIEKWKITQEKSNG